MQNLIIIGAANPTIIRIIEDINKFAIHSKDKYKIIGFLDNNCHKIGAFFFGLPVLGDFSAIEKFLPQDVVLINTIAGSINSRIETTEYFTKKKYFFTNIIHPSVNMTHVDIGFGNLIYENATIHPFVTLGNYSIISSNSGIAHESKIGDYCFVGPRSYICGRVSILNRVYVGAGAVILPSVLVGDGSIIGACSLVRKNVNKGARVFGIPARQQ